MGTFALIISLISEGRWEDAGRERLDSHFCDTPYKLTFQAPAQRLGYAKVDKGEGNESADTVDPTNLSAQVALQWIKEVGQGECNDECRDEEAGRAERHELLTVATSRAL